MQHHCSECGQPYPGQKKRPGFLARVRQGCCLFVLIGLALFLLLLFLLRTMIGWW